VRHPRPHLRPRLRHRPLLRTRPPAPAPGPQRLPPGPTTWSKTTFKWRRRRARPAPCCPATRPPSAAAFPAEVPKTRMLSVLPPPLFLPKRERERERKERFGGNDRGPRVSSQATNQRNRSIKYQSTIKSESESKRHRSGNASIIFLFFCLCMACVCGVQKNHTRQSDVQIFCM
jgi:hypothetical protein